jgi:hypothetical protein
MMGEERASWSTTYRLHELLGVGPGVAMLIAAALVLAVALALRARRAGPARAAIVAGVALAVVFAVQSQASWWQHQRTAATFRAAFPADLEWVDHNAGGPVALLGVTANAPQFDDIDFFNRQVTQAYGPSSGLAGRPGQGLMCPFQFDRSGTLQVGTGCGAMPHGFLINDASARITFYNEVHSASDPNIGRVVQVAPTATPRARSLIILACPRQTPGYHGDSPKIDQVTQAVPCRQAITGVLWLDAPARLAITYRGGPTAHTVTLGKRRWPIPAGGRTTVTTTVAAGYQQFAAQQDWNRSRGVPSVTAITLTSGGGTIPLI